MTTTPTRELNGVDTETLFATIGAVRNQPELARFQFRTTTEYVRGTHTVRGAQAWRTGWRMIVLSFSGAVREGSFR